MQYTTTAALLALLPAYGAATCFLCTGQSGGASQLSSSLMSTNPSNPNNNAGNAPGANDCGVSSFVELTQAQGDLPLVSDCQQMIANIQGDNSYPVTTGGGTIVSFGTCAFNAVSQGGDTEIGNADIIDLVTDSIKKYEKEGYVACQGGFDMYVASAGAMKCDDPNWKTGTQISVDWTLTHSGAVTPQQQGGGFRGRRR